jgi:hypothetical protein
LILAGLGLVARCELAQLLIRRSAATDHLDDPPFLEVRPLLALLLPALAHNEGRGYG